ncbi:hypothetical protein SAMN05216262_105145 [Colwellia chukchiensis]|uniref:Uncharacterized protein n=1 Tax=Colwellia chukchiensis TaxID=641665 RepID=A0A1H7M920_9GAMM|nr:hypothetical protein [Colwellia chukchiensis]SEL07642.1 hypothetical protein SAMN05216262_105145 [Colwellia chukchiensis]
MSKREEPEIPTITLDQDQVKANRKPDIKAKQNPQAKLKAQETKSLSMPFKILLIAPYIGLALAVWHFDQQQQNQAMQVNASNERIQLLENQLSATGEEMGESTVALKVKLEAISEKTELLLSEMDKLWASAWRRNQQEIKTLNSQRNDLAQQQQKNISALAQHNERLGNLQDKVTETEFAINAVSEQVIAATRLKTDIDELATEVNTLAAAATSRDKKQIITATSINELDTSVQLLLERIERLEARLVR